MRNPAAFIGALCAAFLVGEGHAADPPKRQPTLAEIYATLATMRFVDLTHAVGPTTPHWKGARHGHVPEHAFVAMRTDWSKRWPDDAAMQNRDKAGVAHYPGWSMPVLKLLYEDRKIAASGHETTDYKRG